MIIERKLSNKTLIFLIAIDTEKVLKSLNINTDRKYIRASIFPHHVIININLHKEEIIKILKNDKDEDRKEPIPLALEVKIVYMYF